MFATLRKSDAIAAASCAWLVIYSEPGTLDPIYARALVVDLLWTYWRKCADLDTLEALSEAGREIARNDLSASVTRSFYEMPALEQPRAH